MESFYYIKGITRLLRKAGIKGLFKTIYWNVRLFPIGVALRFPLILSSRCILTDCKRGCIKLVSERIKPGMLVFGVTNFNYTFRETTVLSIKGHLIIKGSGMHSFAEGGHMIIRQNGILEIGNDYSIGRHWRFMISAHSTIGDSNLHSWEISLYDTDGHCITDSKGNLINNPIGFNIGSQVWIGSGSTILKGSRIPDGCIMASQSIVTKQLDISNSIYVNDKPVRSDILWSDKQI